jgi:hypothetical protein
VTPEQAEDFREVLAIIHAESLAHNRKTDAMIASSLMKKLEGLGELERGRIRQMTLTKQEATFVNDMKEVYGVETEMGPAKPKFR